MPSVHVLVGKQVAVLCSFWHGRRRGGVF
jgi:hypothetical protein